MIVYHFRSEMETLWNSTVKLFHKGLMGHGPGRNEGHGPERNSKGAENIETLLVITATHRGSLCKHLRRVTRLLIRTSVNFSIKKTSF